MDTDDDGRISMEDLIVTTSNHGYKIKPVSSETKEELELESRAARIVFFLFCILEWLD